MKLGHIVLLIVLISISCTKIKEKKMLKSGIDFSRIDTEVKPQDDFYKHVNGKWLKEFKLPEDKSRYATFTVLREKAKDDVKKIIEEATENKAIDGSENQKIGDLYHSFMDTSTLEILGMSSLDNDLRKLDSIKNISDLSEYLAYADIFTNSPFGIYVYINSKKPTEHITYLSQSGLGLPNRDYYFDQDKKSENIRKEYLIHIEKMFELSGSKENKKLAKIVMNIETQIAKHHWEKEKNRDPELTYNLVSYDDLKSMIPTFDWERWFKSTRMEEFENIVINQADYLENISSLIIDTPIEDWKSYFKWTLINQNASLLTEKFDEQNFYFYSTVLSGVKSIEPRWKRAVSIVSSSMGEIIGKIYVEKHFDQKAKDRMLDLVENLRAAYRISIEDLDWMGDTTKEQAQQKLKKFRPKIGFPNQWKDYGSLKISKNDLFGNIKNSVLDRTMKSREKLNKPIDKEEWGMTPQTVNAYYSPLLNEIVFPAGILQPPFFNMDADDAVNYGAIGAVIGHEMGHGFDDKGSKYDGDGVLRNWWTESDSKKFKNRTKKLIEQYNNYTVFDGTPVNGEFTQGENIGDLAGVVIAYKAYQLSKKGEKDIIIDGLTGDERFFYGWATIWGEKSTEEQQIRQIKTDPHSPGKCRANGPLVSMQEFVNLFKIEEGDGMYLKPEQRVKIW